MWRLRYEVCVSGQEFCKIVIKDGWVLQRVTGSHHIYSHPQIDQILSVPVHRNQDLKVGTLRTLMKTAELSEEDLSCSAAFELRMKN